MEHQTKKQLNGTVALTAYLGILALLFSTEVAVTITVVSFILAYVRMLFS